jgi:hypothetical protein
VYHDIKTDTYYPSGPPSPTDEVTYSVQYKCAKRGNTFTIAYTRKQVEAMGPILSLFNPLSTFDATEGFLYYRP